MQKFVRLTPGQQGMLIRGVVSWCTVALEILLLFKYDTVVVSIIFTVYTMNDKVFSDMSRLNMSNYSMNSIRSPKFILCVCLHTCDL